MLLPSLLHSTTSRRSVHLLVTSCPQDHTLHISYPTVPYYTRRFIMPTTTARTMLAALLLVASAVTTVHAANPVLAPVDLRTAADFAVLSKAGVSTVPQSSITGDVGCSPNDVTALTGFSLIADASNTFSTSTQVTGNLYAANHAGDTPSKMTTAISDMQTAYADAAQARTPSTVNEGNGLLGGKTLLPGVYSFNTGVSISADLTLTGTGSDTDVWIFQSPGTFIVAADKKVILANGTKAENIFWQFAGFVQFGAGAHVEGNVLTATKVDMLTGSSLNGRLLAQTAVQLQKATITAAAGVPDPTSTEQPVTKLRCKGRETYNVEFTAMWSEDHHPHPQFPGSPHFSPLVGASHKKRYSMFASGKIASDGVEVRGRPRVQNPPRVNRCCDMRAAAVQAWSRTLCWCRYCPDDRWLTT